MADKKISDYDPYVFVICHLGFQYFNFIRFT
jgi:hypothetical protein